jgi:hypothetical protein
MMLLHYSKTKLWTTRWEQQLQLIQCVRLVRHEVPLLPATKFYKLERKSERIHSRYKAALLPSCWSILKKAQYGSFTVVSTNFSSITAPTSHAKYTDFRQGNCRGSGNLVVFNSSLYYMQHVHQNITTRIVFAPLQESGVSPRRASKKSTLDD